MIPSTTLMSSTPAPNASLTRSLDSGVLVDTGLLKELITIGIVLVVLMAVILVVVCACFIYCICKDEEKLLEIPVKIQRKAE